MCIRSHGNMFYCMWSNMIWPTLPPQQSRLLHCVCSPPHFYVHLPLPLYCFFLLFMFVLCTYTAYQSAKHLLLSFPCIPLRVYHHRKIVAISENDANRYHQSNPINLIIGQHKSNSILMNDQTHICSICKRKTMRHSYTIYCVCCQREVHINCTVLSPDEIARARNNSHWYCRLCNEDIFPFNHIENYLEFRQALHDSNTSQCLDPLDPDSDIFDPFEINDDSDHIVEYQGELDPDKNYFNQFSYHLSQSSNYYCEDSFNKCIDRCNMNKDLLSLIHLDIRSLPANLTDFMTYMSNVNHIFYIIGFTETWLQPIKIETFGIDGYNPVGLTRQSGKCGGVSLFISDDIVYSEIQELNMVEDHIECIFIKITIRGHTYFIGLVYWPPNSNITEFSNTMHSILDKVASKQCYIMGDYNLDLPKHEIHHPTENFLDIMYANYFIPLINRPTRITRESSTLIDDIFSNNYNVNDHQVNGILKTDITDHYIIFHILSLKIEKSSNNEHKIVRMINSSRTQRYIEKVRNTDWSILE